MLTFQFYFNKDLYDNNSYVSISMTTTAFSISNKALTEFFFNKEPFVQSRSL